MIEEWSGAQGTAPGVDVWLDFHRSIFMVLGGMRADI